jgi:hypothetical protein
MGKEITIKVPSSNASVVAVNMKNNAVVAHGNNMATVVKKAKKAGVANPAVMFVPKPGQRYIY